MKQRKLETFRGVTVTCKECKENFFEGKRNRESIVHTGLCLSCIFNLKK